MIGRAKGLSLVGCELAAANAFFVDADEAWVRFREPFTAEEHWEPPRYHMVGHVGHPASDATRLWTQNGEQKQ